MGNRAKARRQRAVDPVERNRVDAGGLSHFLRQVAEVHPDPREMAFICIGTDCSTGDSFGPWVGTMLKQAGWRQVMGTMEQPCDADRYEHMKADLPDTYKIVAIDACLGNKDTEPAFIVSAGPLYPGHAVGKRLPPAGDFSIAGIIGPRSVKPYWTIQHASLFEVIGMARTVADAIQEAWQLPKHAYALP